MKNHIVKMKPLAIAIGITFSSSVFSGGLLSDLQNSFNDMSGVYANSADANSFKGQTRDYYTGGSLSIRVPRKTYQLATMSPPRISADACGNIDIYGGSFSFINSDQLTAMFQNIGNNAAGAIYSLALESVSPDLNGVIKYFQDMANKVNKMNVDSCKWGSGIVTAGKELALSDNKTQTLKSMGQDVLGLAGDWSGMTDFMSGSGKKKEVLDKAMSDTSGLSEDEKFWLSPGNLLWKAFDKITYGGSAIPENERKLIMAMVGTVVIKNEEENGDLKTKAVFYPPTVGDPLKIIGDDSTSNVTIPVYDCVDGTCSTIGSTIQTMEIPGLRKLVSERIKRVTDLVNSKSSGVTQSDFSAINISYLPVWKLVEQEYRTSGLSGVLRNSEEVIAVSYAQALLDEMLNITDKAIINIRNVNEDPGTSEAFKELKDSLVSVRKRIDEKRKAVNEDFNTYLASIKLLQLQSERIRNRTRQILNGK